MNFDAQRYRNKLPYPKKVAEKISLTISVKNEQDIENARLTLAQAKQRVDKACEQQDEYQKQRKAYDDEEKRLGDLFRSDLAEEHDLKVDSKVFCTIYSRAYEDGHYGGYCEIWDKFADYYDFYEEIKSAIESDNS